MLPRSGWDYPWAVPLRRGLIGPAGLDPSWPSTVSLRDRTPVLAVGSNASPGVLRDKLAGWIGPATQDHLVVDVCVAPGLQVGHSAHVSAGGYVAAAPFRRPAPAGTSGGESASGEESVSGAESAYALGWLTPDQLAALDATEPNYERAVLPPDLVVRLLSGLPRSERVEGVCVYVSRHGVLGERGAPVALMSQREMFAWLRARLTCLAGTAPAERQPYADAGRREQIRAEIVSRGLRLGSRIS